jgi:hypothetical protein
LHAAFAPVPQPTLRPRLSWLQVASECGGVTYQLQMDDSCEAGALASCAFATPEVDEASLTETSYQPARNLPVSIVPPVGALYAWRVRACDASARCSGWSEVRHLFVGRVWEDVNGDGYGDAIVHASTAAGPAVYVFYGNTPFDTVADSSFTEPYDPYRFVGDVNGDGYADFGGLVSFQSARSGQIILGGPDFSNWSSVDLTESPGTSSTNTVLDAAGDLNGDGFADVIVHLNNHARSDIYFGARVPSATPSLVIPTPLTDSYSTPSSSGVGDVNGDGYPDLALVASPDLDSAQLLLGGPAPQPTLSAPLSMGGQCSRSDSRVVPGGDVNGDGYADFFVLCPGIGVFAYFGAPEFVTSWGVELPDTNANTLVANFDADGDGLGDVWLGSRIGPPRLFLGQPSFDLLNVRPGALAKFGTATQLAVSDFNGDGRVDFLAAGSEVQAALGDGSAGLDPALLGSFVDFSGAPVQGGITF